MLTWFGALVFDPLIFGTKTTNSKYFDAFIFYESALRPSSQLYTCLVYSFLCLFLAIFPQGIMQMDKVVRDKHALILNPLLANYFFPKKERFIWPITHSRDLPLNLEKSLSNREKWIITLSKPPIGLINIFLGASILFYAWTKSNLTFYTMLNFLFDFGLFRDLSWKCIQNFQCYQIKKRFIF